MIEKELFKPEESSFADWFTLIKRSRRKYAYSRVKESFGSEPLSFKRILKWIYRDAAYLIQQIRAIFLGLKNYGSMVRNFYGVSKIRQLFQQMYLVIVLRVPVKFYRFNLLFDPKRWELVKELAFENYPVQMLLVNHTFPEEKEVFDNKLIFFDRCAAEGIDTPAPKAIFKGGEEIFTEAGDPQLPAKSVFVKNLCGRRGQGTRKYIYREGKYRDEVNPPMTGSELIDLLKKQSLSIESIMVQEALPNHMLWQKFSSGALSTCRILTARLPDEDSIIVLSATIRMPVGSSDTDNFTTGGIASPVNLGNGLIGTGICHIPYCGQFEFKQHPDTGQKFAGTILPRWSEMLAFTKQVHRSFDTIFVGWDIALIPSGFTVIEGNIGWAATANEAPQLCPLLRTRFPSIFNKWMRKSGSSNRQKKRTGLVV